MSDPIELNYKKLFDLAQTRNEVDALEHNIFSLYLIYRNSLELRRLMLHQRLSNTEKIEMIKSFNCFRPSTLFFELLKLLLEHEMPDKLYSVHEGFSKIVSQKLNRIMVQVYSVIPLSDPIREKITQRLEVILKKTILLKNTVDATLIGGIIIKLPDGKIYNFSLNKALSDIKYSLTEKG